MTNLWYDPLPPFFLKTKINISTKYHNQIFWHQACFLLGWLKCTNHSEEHFLTHCRIANFTDGYRVQHNVLTRLSTSSSNDWSFLGEMYLSDSIFSENNIIDKKHVVVSITTNEELDFSKAHLSQAAYMQESYRPKHAADLNLLQRASTQFPGQLWRASHPSVPY